MATSETEKLQETIDELKERVERLEKENARLKGKTSWKPGHADDYYSVDSGRISSYKNYEQGPTDDAIAAGNCFKTRAEAEEFLEWLKARKTLIDDTKGFKPDWEDTDMGKVYVFYDVETEEFLTGDCRYVNDGENIWFETEEEARESIEKHEKEWRIYMGLPDEKDDDDK